MKNAINWFEIPAKDFARAKGFYEAVFQSQLEPMNMEGDDNKMAIFPSDWNSGGVGGTLISGPGYEPSQSGALIYLNGGDDLAAPLSRVEAAGGKVLVPKTAIGPNGFIAQFTDTEGNRVAFHSPN
ncbi:VOC family protein [Flavilitoribacter nigricans]|uniref:Glyoxalase n=1 Tax=Flavilitoribacter nigricans (strain ATCC 23147 / DSM 23189 / NBRC 102662 / NCIMB 1420 / SS-2) TaxID=1122177 RepID=A0A2D0NFI3_FLAN2|nr:VOC family protein [Flavilitoribacter nigricans]PHN06929.1 glyoxalase [Flavilitoribacter nigricans DSM 23189 = NBRC 102662]